MTSQLWHYHDFTWVPITPIYRAFIATWSIGFFNPTFRPQVVDRRLRATFNLTDTYQDGHYYTNWSQILLRIWVRKACSFELGKSGILLEQIQSIPVHIHRRPQDFSGSLPKILYRPILPQVIQPISTDGLVNETKVSAFIWFVGQQHHYVRFGRSESS